ncbi:MAG: M81 family metallopeptidase [Ruminococcaceae bacterium]|nr:M81 family metallopeptidase [Oscillospiraceae bacterium]
MKKRIFVCALAQESNSFNPIPMGMDSFHPHSTAVSGYENAIGARAVLESEDVEAIYGITMRSNSGAPLAREVVDYFFEDTLGGIKKAGRLDGVLLLLHGATMSEDSDDVCGDLCELVRKTVGEETVISAAFDLHANITEKVAKNLDYICGYWEYPHIDQKKTGERAARMLCDHLFGKKRRTARAAIPMIAPAHAYTTTVGALKALNERAQAMIGEGRIADYTVFQVQPWLDNPLAESAVVVIADDERTAIEAANELALENFNNRKELQGKPLFSVEEVIEKALANKSGKPIILVDSADSVGAGSTGDSAAVLEALLPYADRLRAATMVRDAFAVGKAFEVGVGNSAEFTLGATISKKLSRPVSFTAKVRSLHTGDFYIRGPIAAGDKSSTGKTAVLEIGKLLVRVSEYVGAVFDTNYYNSFGISIENCDLVGVKACTSFRACYEAVAGEICNTSTAGAACPDLFALPYERLPKPTYPFEEISERDIKAARIYR